jgi:hypothetical protein
LTPVTEWLADLAHLRDVAQQVVRDPPEGPDVPDELAEAPALPALGANDAGARQFTERNQTGQHPLAGRLATQDRCHPVSSDVRINGCIPEELSLTAANDQHALPRCCGSL